MIATGEDQVVSQQAPDTPVGGGQVTKESAFEEKLGLFFARYIDLVLKAKVDLLLAETEGSDQKAVIVLNEFADQPAFREFFDAQIKSSKQEEGVIMPLAEKIRLAGINNSASFLIAYKIADHIQCKLTGKDPKTNRLVLPPEQILKFAYRARATIGDDGRYKDSAFAAGLVYDLLSLIILTDLSMALQSKLLNYLELRFTRGIELTLMAVQVARTKKKLGLEKLLAWTCLTREASKVAMAIYYPEYIDFTKITEKHKLPVSVRTLADEVKFGGSYPSFGYILSLGFNDFIAARKALLRFDTPQILIRDNLSDDFDLAAISMLAGHLTRNHIAAKKEGDGKGDKKVDSKSDEPRLEDLNPELGSLKLLVSVPTLLTLKGVKK